MSLYLSTFIQLQSIIDSLDSEYSVYCTLLLGREQGYFSIRVNYGFILFRNPYASFVYRNGIVNGPRCFDH